MINKPPNNNVMHITIALHFTFCRRITADKNKAPDVTIQSVNVKIIRYEATQNAQSMGQGH